MQKASSSSALTNDVNDEDILPLLNEVVCEEDKRLIIDVLGVIRTCRSPDRLCTSWTVSPIDSTGYTLLAYLPKAQSQYVEVTHDDINMIECVNALRVRVGIVQFPQGGTWAIKVRITSHTSPVSMTTYNITRLNVKRTQSWFGFQQQPATKRKRGEGDD